MQKNIIVHERNEIFNQSQNLLKTFVNQMRKELEGRG